MFITRTISISALSLLCASCGNSTPPDNPVAQQTEIQSPAPAIVTPPDVTGYYLYRGDPGAMLVRKDPSGKFFEFEIYTRGASNNKECSVLASEAADSTRVIDTVPVAGMNEEGSRIFNISFSAGTATVDSLEADTESCAMAAGYAGEYIKVSTEQEKSQAEGLIKELHPDPPAFVNARLAEPTQAANCVAFTRQTGRTLAASSKEVQTFDAETRANFSKVSERYLSAADKLENYHTKAASALDFKAALLEATAAIETAVNRPASNANALWYVKNVVEPSKQCLADIG